MSRGINILLTVLIMSATAYCLQGTTKSGEQVRKGICAGGPLIYGKTVKVYQCLPDETMGEFIGEYECLDTGATDGIKKNYVIDVWQPNLTQCQDFMDRVYEDGCQGKVYVEIVDKEQNQNE